MERCPTCRARLKGADLCPRCATDLNLVLTVSAQAQVFFQQATKSVAIKDYHTAASMLKRSLLLQRTDLAIALQHFIIEYQSQQAVHYLALGAIEKAKEAISIVLYLQKTPFALALQQFLQWQKF